MGSSTVSSSSVASSASSSNGSAAPTGTGCVYLGDSSFAPVTSESMSDSSDGGSAGGCFSCRRDGNDVDCPKDGSRAPQVGECAASSQPRLSTKAHVPGS